MNSQSPIIIEKDNGIQRRWLHRAFYFREGEKFRLNSKLLSWVTALGVVVLALLAILLKTNTAYDVKADFDAQDFTTNQKRNIDLSKFESGISASTKVGKTAARSSGLGQTPHENGRRLQVFARSSKIMIPSASLVKARLLTGGSNGLVKAIITESLKASGETLLPAGSILLGNAQSSEERLFINFTEAIDKEGQSLSINAQACSDDDKLPGLKGSRINAHTAKLAANIGLNFLSGMTDTMQEKEVRGGLALKRTNPKNALLSGASKATHEQAREGMGALRDKASVIEVPAETAICVLFAGQNQ